MIKEIFDKLKEDGFSENGLEMAEAFFIFAKNGSGVPFQRWIGFQRAAQPVTHSLS